MNSIARMATVAGNSTTADSAPRKTKLAPVKRSASLERVMAPKMSR